MKRLALLIGLLMLFGLPALYAEEAAAEEEPAKGAEETTEEADKPEFEDWAPNPYDARMEATTEALKEAYEKLSELYNSFNFNELISAYYAYAKNLAEFEKTRVLFEAYEAAFPHKLVLRVMGLNLAKDDDDNDYAVSPNEIIEEDDKVIKPVKLYGGVKAKINMTSVIRGQKVTKSWETNDEGYLGIRHFHNGQLLSVLAESEGYLPFKRKIVMNKSKRKIIRLEQESAGVHGMVWGLPPVERANGRFFQKIQQFPLPEAKLTFTHSSGKKYELESSKGHWRKIRKIMPFWKPGAGRYFRYRMLAGEYKIEVEKEGFASFENTITLEAGKKPTRQDFTLVPEFVHPLDEDGDGDTAADGDEADKGAESSEDLEDPLAEQEDEDKEAVKDLEWE